MTESEIEQRLHRAWTGMLGYVDRERLGELEPVVLHRTHVTPLQLFAELGHVRLEVAELIGSADVQTLADEMTTSHWRVKDVVAHLASWATEFRSEVETVARGGAFDYLIIFTPKIGPTDWNHREVHRREEQAMHDSAVEFDAETKRLQDFVLAVSHDLLFQSAQLPQTSDGTPAGRWRMSPADLILAKCQHDRYHLERIRDWQRDRAL